MTTLGKLVLGAMGRLHPRPATGDSTPLIALPAPRRQGGPGLFETLAARRSTRAFVPTPLPLQTLADLLWAANGVNRPSGGRTAPSALDAQEIDIYVALPQGAYRYDPDAHVLHLAAGRDLRRITGYQDFVDDAPLDLVYVVELLLARQSYLPLVKAGTPMPREGEVQQQTFHLCCSDPRDGVAKFQICSPKRSAAVVLPNEPRVHLENISVKVDSQARPFRERLELDVRITDDLVLEAHARSLNVKDEDRREVHNLEFGIAFPESDGGETSGDDRERGRRASGESSEGGALCIRANVTDRDNLEVVPGEYLYELNPHYFDSRGNPPEVQVLEKLYYQPCAMCGRVSNDPLCKCSDRPAAAR